MWAQNCWDKKKKFTEQTLAFEPKYGVQYADLQSGERTGFPEIRVLSFIRSQGLESGIEYYHTCGKKLKNKERRDEGIHRGVPWIKKRRKRRGEEEKRNKSDP